MADDEEAAPAAEPEPKPLFGGKMAPPFKKKGAAKKFLDDHKLAVISTLVAVIGLVYIIWHNHTASTSGSTSSTVSGQATPAANNAGTADSTSALAPSSPYDMQPWWTGTAGGGGGGALTTTATGTGSTATPPAKKSTGAAKAQPSSHPASTAAKTNPNAASVMASPHTSIVAGLYAPLSPSSSPTTHVAPSAHPASHVAVGGSHITDSSVVVPFTYRSGVPAPTAHLTGHVAAPAKRQAGRRIAGHAA